MSNETATTTNTTRSRKPALIAYSVRERGEKEAKWTEIGVALENKDGSLTVLFDLVPLTGKIVLRKPKPRENS